MCLKLYFFDFLSLSCKLSYHGVLLSINIPCVVLNFTKYSVCSNHILACNIQDPFSYSYFHSIRFHVTEMGRSMN